MMIAFISLDGVVVANANVPSKLKCHRVNITILRSICCCMVVDKSKDDDGLSISMGLFGKQLDVCDGSHVVHGDNGSGR